MEPKPGKTLVAAQTGDGEYDAPAVERVMTAEDLQREVQYAGIQIVSDPN